MSENKVQRRIHQVNLQLLFTKHYEDEQNKEVGKKRASGTHRRGEKCVQNLNQKT